MTRNEIPQLVSDLVDGRPCQWFGWRHLSVFFADASEQLLLRRRIKPIYEKITKALGGPICVIFHTTKETKRLYPEIQWMCEHVCPEESEEARGMVCTENHGHDGDHGWGQYRWPNDKLVTTQDAIPVSGRNFE
jgi:hypothetical protein